MKISRKWLSEYVSLDNISTKELADKLTTAGIEVEKIDKMAYGDNLVIGKVISCEKHPDSDHLNVCKVDIASEILQIVCGAPNCKEGIKVIVAKVNAILPEIEIKAAKVRGVTSNGMLCSLKELGVEDKYLREDQINGNEILDDTAVVGNSDVLGYLELDDDILDVSLTPNRSDCLSMFNFAKEVGAIFRKNVNLPELSDCDASKSNLSVKIESDKCTHLLGRVIKKINVKQSPTWMKRHLQAAGIKPINNVVDISNYVMLETGQPLHFYDLSKMDKEELVVKDGYKGVFRALDEIDYELNENDLIIENNSKVVGIAGIMGSDGSKIDENTKGIIIEAANFNSVAIRNTSRRLNLFTEAANRFTKGFDLLAQEKAMLRATELLIKYADASEVEGIMEEGNDGYTKIYVKETLDHCNNLLGTNYTIDQVMEVLKALDFNPIIENDEIISSIPSYRRDISISQDIDEEIIRLIGFDSLPTTLPSMESTVGTLNSIQKKYRKTKSVLSSLGLTEINTYTLVKKDYVENGLLPFGESIKLASAMSDDRSYVRNSLINSVLECLSFNQARKGNNINLFEISQVYQEDKNQNRCALLLSENLHQSRLHQKNIEANFYVMKGIVMTWLNQMGFESKVLDFRVNEEDTNNFHPFRSASLYINNVLIGIFGEIHPNIQKKYDVTKCVYGEFLLDTLFDQNIEKVYFKTFSKYPSVSRDIALVCNESLSAKEIENVISEAGRELISEIEIFDVYQGAHIDEGYKSIAITLNYQAIDHTLVDEEVLEIHQKILKQLEEKLQVVLRS
ncbi:MAG: phenylalanine--tRNA ligase subunit beta [Anaerorhabdus sp.]